MIIYVNSYVPGDGYSIKYFDSQEEENQEFRDGRGPMEDWERKIFTRTGAKLFWGIFQGTAFGCVRQLETGIRDENGRRCFHNIAFHEEAPGGQDEEPATSRIISYVITHYDDFVRQADGMISRRDGDFQVDVEMLGKMRKEWEKSRQKADCGKAWLVPESNGAYFLKNTGAPFREEDIRQMELKETGFMNMFFYCSGPSTGYVLKQIDSATGRVLQEGKQAGKIMSSHGFAMLTRGGADMALFKKDGIMCFVAKNIESESRDHYGRRKYMSLCFEAKGKSEAMTCQLAAWALLDFPAFCRDMTGCMEVFDGPEGYCIGGEELKQVTGRFEKRLYLPEEKASKEWEMIVKPVKEGEFRYLVLNASLEYFNRSVKMDVDRRKINLCIDSEGFRKRKESPLNLSFEDGEDGFVKPDPKGEREPGTIRNGKGKERVTAQEVLGGEAEKVDLLESRWFRILLLIGGIAAIAGAIILGNRFFSHSQGAAAMEFGRMDGAGEAYLWIEPDWSPKA